MSADETLSIPNPFTPSGSLGKAKPEGFASFKNTPASTLTKCNINELSPLEEKIITNTLIKLELMDLNQTSYSPWKLDLF